TILLVAIFLIVPFLAIAEDAADLRRNIILDQKRLVVVENMFFTAEEAEKFWPVYKEYQEKLFEINMQRSGLLSYYKKNYKTLDNQQAEEIIDSMVVILDAHHSLLKDFIFILETGSILPAKKIFRYLQVEQYIFASEQHEAMKDLPLLY
ncbi:MAG: hypothetical protein RBR06_05720, partial [Desulfuromonadaceae bacterium]|nr:hypothetical protein [Desulfuromonadaceae bacterium]